MAVGVWGGSDGWELIQIGWDLFKGVGYFLVENICTNGTTVVVLYEVPQENLYYNGLWPTFQSSNINASDPPLSLS